MGGSGSGRWDRYGSKDTADGQRSLDVNWLRRNGRLRKNWQSTVQWSSHGKEVGSIQLISYGESIELVYRIRIAGGDWQDVREPVNLAWTPCHYGGRRPWFLCPYCGRRVGKLYGAGRLFLCRQCCGLVYESQREDAAFRLLRKAQNIRWRLGGSGGMCDPFPKAERNALSHLFSPDETGN